MFNNDVLIDIPWETRNLGVQSFSINKIYFESLNEAILKESIALKLKKYTKIFIQARVDKKNMKLYQILCKVGFYFIETSLTPYTLLDRNIFLKEFMKSKTSFLPLRYDSGRINMSVLDKSDKELCNIVMKIAKESFIDDRFHLDPNCSKNIADRRFLYWVKDIIADVNTEIYILKDSGKEVAFLARKEDYLMLAGFLREYANKGLGDYFWLSILKDMYEKNIFKVYTGISINNISVLNLYTRLGFKFRNALAVFHYWGK